MRRQKLVRNIVRPLGEEIVSGSIDTVLASLYRRILNDLHFNTTRFNQHMEAFLSDRSNRVPQNIKERSSARGNLTKELLKAAMTWKVFCKGLKFINVRRFKIAVTLYHANHQETYHEKVINLGDWEADMGHQETTPVDDIGDIAPI